MDGRPNRAGATFSPRPVAGDAATQLPGRSDPRQFERTRGPSTIMACELCAGMAATEALKILLGRGKVVVAPRGIALRCLPRQDGADLAAGRQQQSDSAARPGDRAAPTHSCTGAGRERGRDEPRARADPRSRPLGAQRRQHSAVALRDRRRRLVIVHGFDTRDHCVYDLNGHPSQIALGALLETLRIAASGFGLRAAVRRLDAPETQPTFDVRLVADAAVAASPLIPCITVRAVQRRAMKTRPLNPAEKRELEASVVRITRSSGWKAGAGG